MQLVQPNELTQLLKLLISGYSGSGKTTICGSAGLDERTSPVLHCDAGGNPTSLARFGANYNGTVIKLQKLSDLNPLYDWLFKGQPTDHPMVTKMGLTPGFKTVVLDGITRIQYFSFDLAMGLNDSVGSMIAKPEWQHYGAVLNQMTHDFSRFYDLPMHVIVTSLEEKEKIYIRPNDDSSAFYQFNPAIDGKSAGRVIAMAQAVIRVCHKTIAEPLALAEAKAQKGNKEPQYSIAQFVQTQTAYAKDQHGFNAKYLADLTIAELLDRLERKRG